MALFNKQTSKKFFSKSILIGGCMVFGYAAANDNVDATDTFLPFSMAAIPGASLSGMGGNGETAIGDLMAPVFGHPLNFTYVDPQVFYHSSKHEVSGSLGLGQRWMAPTAGILGAYVFGDYNHSIDGNDFWFVSPGIERLGQILDFSANLYIPVANQRENTGLKFADQTGDFDEVTFTGHTQYDELVNTFESTGWGGDTQIGVRVPYRNSKIYLGAYYFDPKDNSSITGGLIRAEVPVNNFISVIMSEAYDSQYHNTLKAGLTLWFGGRTTGYTYSGNLADRMVDPIQRNAIAVAGGAHNAQPIVQGVEGTNQIAIEKSNISFFVPTNTPSDGSSAVSGDGTYEDPYKGMSQSNVDNANYQNNRNFYINSGTYNATYDPSVNPDFIVLNNDQLYGRQNNFTQTASGTLRPFINFSSGGFLVPGGDSSDSFSDLQLIGNDVTGTAGIFVDHESGANVNIPVNDLLISHFGDGIDIYNTTNTATTVSVNNSQITDNSAGGVDQLRLDIFGGYSGGIVSLNSGAGNVDLSINNSTVANNSNDLGTANWAGIGLYNNDSGSSTLSVNNANVSNNDGGVATAAGAGIVLDNEGSGALTANIDNSAITGNSNGVIAIANLYTPSTNSLDLSIRNSNLSSNDSAGLFLAKVSGVTNINASIWNSQLSNNGLYGITLVNVNNEGALNLTINHSQLNANGQDGLIADIVGNSGNTSVKIKGSKMIGNGLNGIDFGNAGNSGDTWLGITNSTIENNMNDGINIDNEGNTGDFNLYVKNVSLSNNGKDGFEFMNLENTGDVDLDLEKVEIANNGGSGIDVNNNLNFGSLYLNVSNALIFDNANSGINVISSNSPGDTIVDINRANIYGNNLGVNVASNYNSKLALEPTNVTVYIDQSRISNNNIGINLTSTASSGNNFLPSGSNLTATISNSIIAQNLVAGISANSIATIPGSKTTANTTVSIDHSLITGNAIGLLASSSTLGVGSTATTTVNVSQSAIVLNGVGVSALSVRAGGVANTDVNFTQSVVAGNLVGLTAVGQGSNITVDDQTYFRGLVEFANNGTVTFPDISPNSGQRVACTPTVGCFIINP